MRCGYVIIVSHLYSSFDSVRGVLRQAVPACYYACNWKRKGRLGADGKLRE